VLAPLIDASVARKPLSQVMTAEVK